MAAPIVNPPMPLLAPIPGGFMHGRIIRIQGSVTITAQRFAINLQCGPNTNPRDDLALHFNPRFQERAIARNSLAMGQWGQEERHGHFPFIPGQGFEILIMSESQQYKIAVNGQHFCEFRCRVPPERVSYITADGDVMITMITFEGTGGHGHPGHMPAPMPMPMPTPMPAPMPGMPGMPGAPYNPGHGHPTPYPTHPTHPGGHVGAAPYPGQPGYPGAVPYPGGYGHLSPKSQKKAAKKQAKAQKKAMKYGIPLAGAAVGGYALHKGMKHHKHGYHGHSSSSSSSSSEEE